MLPVLKLCKKFFQPSRRKIVCFVLKLWYNVRRQAEPARSGPRVGVVLKRKPGGAGQSEHAPVLFSGNSAGYAAYRPTHSRDGGAVLREVLTAGVV